MRTLTPTLQYATETPRTFYPLIRAELQPSHLLIDGLDSHPPAGEDGLGLPLHPLAQEIAYVSSGSCVVTFFVNDGTLAYMLSGSDTVTDTDLSTSAKPGVWGDYLFVASGTSLVRKTIDWAALLARSGSPWAGSQDLGAVTLTPVAVHGAGDTGCAVVSADYSGLQVAILEAGQVYEQAGRFLVTSGSGRMPADLALCSAALRFGDEIYVYASNPQLGNVQAFKWNPTTHVTSDTFEAVVSNIDSYLSEFRLTNAYVRGGTAYLCGQLQRYEAIETVIPYTLVLRSTNAHTFSLDAFSLVNADNYRLLATTSDDRLWLAGSNRVGSAPLTWNFAGTSGSGYQSLSLTHEQINSFNDSDGVRASLNLKAGNEVLMFHPWMVEGSRLIVQTGLKTTAGDEYITYGTYIISNPQRLITQGGRGLSIQATSESEWFLSDLTMPFYAEILSKSAIYDPMTEDFGNLYPVGSSAGGPVGTPFVDFWNAKPYEDPAHSIDGIDLNSGGGEGCFDDSPNHTNGVVTQDLQVVLGSYPVVADTGRTVFHIYGWSRNDDDPPVANGNDKIELLLFLRKKDGSEIVMAAREYTWENCWNWPDTYPDPNTEGQWPIEYEVLGVPAGAELLKLGLVAASTHATVFCPTRIELIDGLTVTGETGNNTPWKATPASGFMVPDGEHAYVMFSQVPSNAFNYQIQAEFNWTAGSGFNLDMDVGCGLLGLATDGDNFILLRFNLSNDKLELVKVRGGGYTVLADYGMDGRRDLGTLQMLFNHRNGHFTGYVKIDNLWTRVLTYDWDYLDGPLVVTTTQQVLHTGIWGSMLTPSFKCVGFELGVDRNNPRSEYIAAMPGTNLNTFLKFPSSGQVQIDDNVYGYTSKVVWADPKDIRGPFQLRNLSDGSTPEYLPPFGHGLPGLECFDYDKERAEAADNNWIIATDQGVGFKIVDTERHVFITTAGQPVYIDDRTRYYADSKVIAKQADSLWTRCYVTGGLKLAAEPMVKGESVRHSYGSVVRTFAGEATIYCRTFIAASGDTDSTVADLIEMVCRTAGATARFPGDTAIDSLSLSANTPVEIESQRYTTALDVTLEVASLGIGEWLQVETNADLTAQAGTTGIGLRLTHSEAGLFMLALYGLGGSAVDSFPVETTDTAHKLRVLFHENFVNVYLDDAWVYTFAFPRAGVSFPVTVTASLRAGQATTVSNVRVEELSDWREAVYLPLETDGKSAISAVIQERPVETISRADGSLSFWYEPVRSSGSAPQDNLHRHAWGLVRPRGASSDGIIYYQKTGILQYPDYAKAYGLGTRVYQLSQLDTGALRAAGIILKRSYEAKSRHEITMRPDFRFEVGDQLVVHYAASGTEREITETVIIESISFNFGSGQAVMTVTGRGAL